MSYNNYGFWAFFALVLTLYWRLGHRGQNRLLLAASYVFYGWWDYRFLFLILLSTVVDYIGGLGVAGVRISRRCGMALAAGLVTAAAVLCWRMPKVAIGTAAVCALYVLALPRLYALPEAQRRKGFLTISMVANLGILGFFKYFDFFQTSFARALTAIGLHASPHILGLLLPVGISFYTFQAMSYTIDIYRGQVEPTESFADFALFVCFFPHLVAGPIMRAHTLLPQVVQPRKLQPGAAEEGLILVLVGLFKKIVLADNMAPIANAVFYRFADGHAAGVSGVETLLGLYAFALQIYGDFSGYSAVARGISKWLGFELVINFDLPYLAVSPSDFWKRWHISLSTWLRDYLYIPLGGNRGSKARTYGNLMLTMLLGGLWHGASWTFVAWGFYQGVLLCLFKLSGLKDKFAPGLAGGLSRAVRIFVMFHLTCFGWLLFRADTFGTAARMLARILSDHRVTATAATMGLMIVFYAGPLSTLEKFFEGEKRLDRLTRSPALAQAAAYAYLAYGMFFFCAQRAYEFIYFQF